MFKEMFHFTPGYGKPFIVKDFGNHRWEISGVIGIVGSTEGVIVIRLTRNMAFKLLKETGMVGKTSKEINSLVTGMVGELANIISGNAINVITDKRVDITVPIIVQGPNHIISWPQKGPIISIPFTTPYGPFEMQINIIYHHYQLNLLYDKELTPLVPVPYFVVFYTAKELSVTLYRELLAHSLSSS